MKVLSWNIYMLPLLVPRRGKRTRARALVGELLKHDFDIIAFQEAFLPASRNIIWQGLSHVYPYQYGPANNTPHIKSSSGLWVVSKIKLKLLDTIEFKQHAGWDSLVRKGAMLLEGEWKGHPFQLVNTHLQAGVHQQIRQLQMEQMNRELILTNKQTGVPQFICGDMNVSADEVFEYENMLKYLQAENGEISGIEKHSYNGVDNLIARWMGARAKVNFDYILICHNGVKFTSINRQVSVLKKDKMNVSDHYGVVADLEF